MHISNEEKRVYLGIPSYDGTVSVGTMMGVLNASEQHVVSVSTCVTSLLPKTFNNLWGTAVGGGFDYFAMLHADIEPEDRWVDKLVEIAEAKQADVVSCCVPIKDEHLLTSTAMWRDGKDEPHYRLNVEDLRHLPVSFNSADVNELIGVQGKLALNTGCWVARLPAPGNGTPWTRKVGFQIHSGLSWHETDDGISGRSWVIPEDWDFSRQLHNLGLSLYATQAVELVHHGHKGWRTMNRSQVDFLYASTGDGNVSADDVSLSDDG